MNWKNYQENTAEFFRSLGLDAQTDITIQGIRTKHDIDVLVKSHHVGFDVTWVVECKYWKEKVSKLHVLALREIVSDTGADRGILLAENGFQSGALEAANLTNVHVTSLANVTNTASNEILSMRLGDIYDRLIWCKKEYWKIPKNNRIGCGLRPEVRIMGYSGDQSIKAGEDLISKGFRGTYPISPDETYRMFSKETMIFELPTKIHTLKDLLAVVEPLVEDLENKINACKEQRLSTNISDF